MWDVCVVPELGENADRRFGFHTPAVDAWLSVDAGVATGGVALGFHTSDAALTARLRTASAA